MHNLFKQFQEKLHIFDHVSVRDSHCAHVLRKGEKGGSTVPGYSIASASCMAAHITRVLGLLNVS